jgi:hypothetical protein
MTLRYNAMLWAKCGAYSCDVCSRVVFPLVTLNTIYLIWSFEQYLYKFVLVRMKQNICVIMFKLSYGIKVASCCKARLVFVRGKPTLILCNRGWIRQWPDRPMSCSVWSALSFYHLPKRGLARLSRNNSSGSVTAGIRALGLRLRIAAALKNAFRIKICLTKEFTNYVGLVMVCA